ncbi:hypothetical protein AB0393_29200 [Streptomyces cyaneofuscatus]|uniref:hypothetical protein n=1 Tax=Streptomyces cyaneofuscatus TaxID=66883 RepID=UPI00344B05F0
MTEQTVEDPVSALSAHLQHLVRSDPARVLSAVSETVLALHAAALEAVNVARAGDVNLYEAGKSLAAIDDAGIEIVVAVRELLGPACQDQADAERARMEALIATLPAPRVGRSGWGSSLDAGPPSPSGGA